MLSRLRLPLLIALLFAASPVRAELPTIETGRLLAGQASDATLSALPHGQQLRALGELARESWAGYIKRIGEPMQKWAQAELEQRPGETVFYPFSGPDLTTAMHLYPEAGRYVLVAIQAAGRVPDFEAMDADETRAYIKILEQGWRSFTRLGFFRTQDLKANTGKNTNMEGITPILMGFAAMHGFDILKVEPVRINREGTGLEPHPGDIDAPQTWYSVRLTLKKDERQVLVDYVWINLADYGLENRANAVAWLERAASNRVVIKAASHLLQERVFSTTRRVILENAQSIIQDETGPNYEHLTPHFDVTLYGRLNRVHKLWSEGLQRKLIEAYRTRDDVRRLPFKYGYEKSGGSAVQVSTRKK